MKLFRHPPLALWAAVVAVLAAVIAAAFVVDDRDPLPSPRRTDTVDRQVILGLRARIPALYDLVDTGGDRLAERASTLAADAELAAQARVERFGGPDDVSEAFESFSDAARRLSELSESDGPAAASSRSEALSELGDASDDLAAATVPPPL